MLADEDGERRGRVCENCVRLLRTADIHDEEIFRHVDEPDGSSLQSVQEI
jgi:hypothetical protein